MSTCWSVLVSPKTQYICRMFMHVILLTPVYSATRHKAKIAIFLPTYLGEPSQIDPSNT
jgi:hypothetical protein